MGCDERTAEAIRHQSIHAITVPNEYMRARLATDFACPVDRISVLPYGCSLSVSSCQNRILRHPLSAALLMKMLHTLWVCCVPHLS